MSAPFNPRTAQVRDPVAAFVCDEETAALAQTVVAEFGWAPEKVQPGGLRNAVQQLSVMPSPALLLVDLSDCGDPLVEINALAEVCEPGTIVVALGTVNDVRLYRALTAHGLSDYLVKPCTADQLRDAITHAQLALASPRGGEAASADRRTHMMAAVVGARGGVGASSVAASVAWWMSEAGGRSTALLDLDVHFGTGALALDLEPGRGLTDAIENPHRIDGLFIERAVVRPSERLAVLSAEAPLGQPLQGDGAAFYQLQDELRQAFDCTIIDLPRGMLVQHPHLFYDIHAAVIVTELTLAAARDCIRLISWMKATAPQARLIVVVNKLAPGQPEIARKEFEVSIERPIDLVVPHDAKLAANAARLGKPMAEAGRTTKAGQALGELAARLKAVGEDAGAALAPPRRPSLVGRLGSLRTLLRKPAKG